MCQPVVVRAGPPLSWMLDILSSKWGNGRKSKLKILGISTTPVGVVVFALGISS